MSGVGSDSGPAKPAAPRAVELDSIDNVPLTERARAAILEAIVQQRFAERLPSEAALAEMLNVSRTTIRSALQSLEQDGVVTRQRAIGTTINAHVRRSALALQRTIGLDGLLREKGYEVSVEIEWERDRPSPEIVAAFDLDPHQDSMILAKSYYADGDLAIFAQSVLPWAILKTDPAEDMPASIFEFSRRDWHQPIDHTMAQIIPTVKRSDDTTRLNVEIGEAFTRLHEHHYTSRGERLAVSIIDLDSSFFYFEVFRRR